MKKSILTKRSTFAVAVTLAGIITVSVPKAQAQDSQEFIYCALTDAMHSTVYYSDVFAGDYSQRLGYSVAFTNSVHGQFSNVIGVANCFFESDSSRARAAEDQWRSSDRGIYRHVVSTKWTY